RQCDRERERGRVAVLFDRVDRLPGDIHLLGKLPLRQPTLAPQLSDEVLHSQDGGRLRSRPPSEPAPALTCGAGAIERTDQYGRQPADSPDRAEAVRSSRVHDRRHRDEPHGDEGDRERNPRPVHLHVDHTTSLWKAYLTWKATLT